MELTYDNIISSHVLKETYEKNTRSPFCNHTVKYFYIDNGDSAILEYFVDGRDCYLFIVFSNSPQIDSYIKQFLDKNLSTKYYFYSTSTFNFLPKNGFKLVRQNIKHTQNKVGLTSYCNEWLLNY